ncbi:hypothetical protein PQX77_021974 [Marasmius sp. AFHP31]|nr:hypothetical protein PQX77_021974 [Marasmius sp. AFHP31]
MWDAYGRNTEEFNLEDLAHSAFFDDLGWSAENENEDENSNCVNSSSENETSSSEDESRSSSEERSSSETESSRCSTDEEDDYGEETAVPRRNEHVEESLDRIHEMMEFIRTYNFEFEKEQLPEEAWDAFTNPPQERIDLSDKQLRRSIQYYLILSHASEETYDHPNAPLLSYDQVRRRIQAITGIYPIRVDKCTIALHSLVLGESFRAAQAVVKRDSTRRGSQGRSSPLYPMLRRYRRSTGTPSGLLSSVTGYRKHAGY